MSRLFARDSDARLDAYWVGPFEEFHLELGNRAHHWEVEENDGAGGLLDGFVAVDAAGFPTYAKHDRQGVGTYEPGF